MNVVINRCWGGFSLSDEAVLWIRVNCPCPHKGTLWGEKYEDGELKDSAFLRDSNFEHSEFSRRACPSLVKVVEHLGTLANGKMAKLKVVNIPDGIQWEIDDYDGIEQIEEKHRSWI